MASNFLTQSFVIADDSNYFMWDWETLRTYKEAEEQLQKLLIKYGDDTK